MQTELQNLMLRIEEVKNNNLPFVIYKQPNKNRVKAIFQKDDKLNYISDFTESGFIFSPFDNITKTIFFPNKECEFLTVSYEYSIKIDLNSVSQTLGNDVVQKEKQNHITLVEKGIDFIKKGKASKIVLSRKEELIIEKKKITDIFQKLLQNYDNAFVYMWFHPKIGLWMGATPETLLNVKDGKFETMALAGTQSYHGTLDVTWDEKEKQEQQFVTDFMRSKLSYYNLKISEPHTVKSGGLLHICSKIKGELVSQNQLFKLIKKLHPTPAVCGLPKNEAKNFILKNESYNREFYTGFLGELNINEQSDLFVNLRCMQIKPAQSTDEDKKAIIYIGGGITIDSNPEKEWEETIAKSEVMKRVIANV